MRSRCPICGSPVDRSKPPVPYEEMIREKENQKVTQDAVQAELDKGISGTPGSPEQIGNSEGTACSEKENISGQVPGSMPGLSGRRPGMQASGTKAESGTSTSMQDQRLGLQSGTLVQRTDMPSSGPGIKSGQRPGILTRLSGQQLSTPFGVSGQRPGLSTGLPGQRQSSSSPVSERAGIDSHTLRTQKPACGNNFSSSGFSLEYFGERISIPTQGAWIGREGLGREWFDGNLMISRKHVYVRPNPKTGRLQVNEDKSLNGVFYTGSNGIRIRIEGTMMMEPGEVLWIYNIPLRIVQ